MVSEINTNPEYSPHENVGRDVWDEALAALDAYDPDWWAESGPVWRAMRQP